MDKVLRSFFNQFLSDIFHPLHHGSVDTSFENGVTFRNLTVRPEGINRDLEKHGVDLRIRDGHVGRLNLQYSALPGVISVQVKDLDISVQPNAWKTIGKSIAKKLDDIFAPQEDLYNWGGQPPYMYREDYFVQDPSLMYSYSGKQKSSNMCGLPADFLCAQPKRHPSPQYLPLSYLPPPHTGSHFRNAHPSHFRNAQPPPPPYMVAHPPQQQMLYSTTPPPHYMYSADNTMSHVVPRHMEAEYTPQHPQVHSYRSSEDNDSGACEECGKAKRDQHHRKTELRASPTRNHRTKHATRAANNSFERTPPPEQVKAITAPKPVHFYAKPRGMATTTTSSPLPPLGGLTAVQSAAQSSIRAYHLPPPPQPAYPVSQFHPTGQVPVYQQHYTLLPAGHPQIALPHPPAVVVAERTTQPSFSTVQQVDGTALQTTVENSFPTFSGDVR